MATCVHASVKTAFYLLFIRVWHYNDLTSYTKTDYNYLCMKCPVTIIIIITAELMRRSDDLLNNNILVFLQLAVNGETDNIFLMVSLRTCATAANKHKIWIKQKRGRRETQITIIYMYQCRIIPQSCMHHAVSCREFVKSLPKQQHL